MHFLFPSAAALLLSVTAVLGPLAADGEAGAPGTTLGAEVHGLRGAGVTDLRQLRSPTIAVDLPGFELADLSVTRARPADGPTCMGLPATPGGIGSAGDDVITGTSGRDVIVAGSGNDVVYGRNGKDVVCGGPGDDTLVGGRNPDDWRPGAKRGDRLSGGSGNDHLVDRWGYADILIGGSGDDRVTSKNGWEHTLIGGPGADHLVSEEGGDNDLLGGSGPDVLVALTGWGYSRYHAGGTGRDVIDVGPTGDILVGLTADGDQLTVHGDGYVVPMFSGSPTGIYLDMTTGTARRIGADPEKPADTITFLHPSEVSWIIYGSRYADEMLGSDGNDTFFALSGDDTLRGNGGDDGLLGFGGDDFIVGGDGSDDADGGAGSDTCDAEEAVKCEQ